MTYKQLIIISLLLLGFASVVAQTHRGKASYYSKRATGARTASGARLHHDSLTCAHRTYAFGTLLRVRNITNGKEVVVKVTDRGPFGRGRIIDLSYRAARELNMLSQGVVMVEVEPVEKRPPYRLEKLEVGIPQIELDTSNTVEMPIIDFKRKRDAITQQPSPRSLKIKTNRPQTSP